LLYIHSSTSFFDFSIQKKEASTTKYAPFHAPRP
jgi:hypothetical protein